MGPHAVRSQSLDRWATSGASASEKETSNIANLLKHRRGFSAVIRNLCQRAPASAKHHAKTAAHPSSREQEGRNDTQSRRNRRLSKRPLAVLVVLPLRPEAIVIRLQSSDVLLVGLASLDVLLLQGSEVLPIFLVGGDGPLDLSLGFSQTLEFLVQVVTSLVVADLLLFGDAAASQHGLEAGPFLFGGLDAGFEVGFLTAEDVVVERGHGVDDSGAREILWWKKGS
ncbi:uncharacterized protein K489DRAFT_221216 [Dissoconium aciculare CBS 342.82]|uniref:Uncharacterized protein n=1 Tax=Dissoconium aciculare CBS 342.82 TaxID=1314786 RepID=A0A6J3M4J9_9PEZI|nr:uncharacterized protein K489DRAFT_221216 [Dissoconium aciculare CBS 342.82]KAF1822955.1 hypothetical protein K489DRAFT_221216 [Dissoconium aciculare CBS 342.82]